MANKIKGEEGRLSVFSYMLEYNLEL